MNDSAVIFSYNRVDVFGELFSDSDIWKYYKYSEQWPADGVAPPCLLLLASYRDGSIAVKNVTKNYKESTNAPVLKITEGVEPSEASTPRPS